MLLLAVVSGRRLSGKPSRPLPDSPSLMTQSECGRNGIEKQIRDWCESQGFVCVKNVPGHGIPKGWPDLSIYAPLGFHVLVEVKAEDGALSPIQRHFIRLLSNLGHRVMVARSVLDVEREFQSWQKQKTSTPNLPH